MIDLFVRLGAIGWPLLGISVMALALLFVALARVAGGIAGRVDVRAEIERAVAAGNPAAARTPAARLPDTAGEAVRLVLDHASWCRADREDLVSANVGSLKRRLLAPLGGLHLAAIVSPLLGLLGTVLGMVVAFRDMAETAGPITPAVLADGLWQALLTTIVGLVIALPSLVAAHVLKLWVTARIADLAEFLSRLSLLLDRSTAPPSGLDALAQQRAAE